MPKEKALEGAMIKIEKGYAELSGMREWIETFDE